VIGPAPARIDLMETEHNLGLTIMVASVEEALGTDWTDRAGSADLVRVHRPDAGSWPRLRAAGFFPRPDRVSWLAPASADEPEFLARLSRKGREDVRRAVRTAAESGVEITVRDPFDAAFYDQFLVLYRNQVAAMRHGLPIAVRERERVLDDPERFFAVSATHDGRLVGACIAERRPERGATWIRFCAVDETRRRQSLARALYVKAVVSVGHNGPGTVVLGTDLGLFGHITEVGLLGFKTRLGFRPRPSHELAPADGFDVADRILSLRNLADPSVALAYQDSSSEDLMPIVFGSDPCGHLDRITLASRAPRPRPWPISEPS
jgi:GNAT superfamily N-acetyltransferase